MPLADTVARIGFRKWYERELLSSHAYMVLCILSVVAMIGSLEAFSGADTSARAMNVMFFVVCAIIGAWSLRRYLYLLLRAETAANQAKCPDCGEYGRFRVVRDRQDREFDACCRKCGHEWVIEYGQ